MNKSPVTFPSTIPTKYFSNFFGTCEPSCRFSHVLFLSLNPPAFKLQRHMGPSMLNTVADKGLNIRHFSARGIFGMFMDKVLQSLHTSFDLWLNSLRSQLADLLWICTRAPQRREVIARLTSCKKFRLLSILDSWEFCSVIFKAAVPHHSVGSCSCHIHCEPFTKSKPRSD